MEINEIIKEFKVIDKKEYIKEATTVYVLKHEKSGATLVYLDSLDNNKCFAVGFKTLPEDSTGVPHIIEHSVLCGSGKYPLREPFVNLLKGSLATFLNAFTSTDFTCYPVASLDDKDFKNLMSCYLDSVFNPLSIKDPKAFLQEGWHLEMHEKDETPTIKGVVYNEMIGAMSSPEERLSQEINTALYSGSTYMYNSGGEPEDIPNLTYEDYKAFYNKYYRPENAVFYLYGKMDLAAHLDMILEYVNKFEYIGYDYTIKLPNKKVDLNVVKEYEIAEDEDLDMNSYVAYTKALYFENPLRDLRAFKIVCDLLTENNDSPLSKYILDKGYAEDINSYVNTSSIIPSVTFYIDKTDKKYKDRFKKDIEEGIKKILEEGLDKTYIKAILNKMLFNQIEKDSGGLPQGLLHLFNVLSCFTYNFNYTDILNYEDDFNFYFDSLDKGYFESLIEKYILNNNSHEVLVSLVPSKTLAKEKAKKLNDKLKKIKENMTEDEVAETIRVTKELELYQSTPDSLEALKTLPTLSLDEINIESQTLGTKEEKDLATTYIYHEISNDQITYLRLYFDISHFTLEELKYAKLIGAMLLDLDTLNYNTQELNAYQMLHLGGFRTSLNIIKNMEKNEVSAKFKVDLKALKKELKEMIPFTKEVLLNTIFDPLKVKRLLNQFKSGLRSEIIENGMALSITDACKNESLTAYLDSNLKGYLLYEFINKLLDLDINEVVSNLEAVYKKLLNGYNLTVSLTGTKDNNSFLKNELKSFEFDRTPKVKTIFERDKENGVATLIPSDVSYCGASLSLDKVGYKHNGKLNVLAHILRLDYLWNEVRVKGGAYGTTISFSGVENNCQVGSYRDPNVRRTYETYNNIKNYIENFNMSLSEFKTNIIGAVGAYDKPLSINALSNQDDLYYLTGITIDYRDNIKAEMLKTTIDDIKSFAKLFENFDNLSDKACYGNEGKILEYNKFANIRKL